MTTTAVPRGLPSALVTPGVVGHRGASGHRPEHTLAAYRTAIAAGADGIELDLVITADGVLVARHETDLRHTTDVESRPDWAARRTTRTVDGAEVGGWWVEDLTLAEVRELRARERWPQLRPDSARHDGEEPVPTLDEVLTMVAEESAARGRRIAVMLELKDAAWFDARGLPLDRALLDALRRHGLDHPRSRVTVMSFEPTILHRLAGQVRVPLVQLLERPHLRPADLAAAGDPTTYGDLATPAGLARIEEYADGIGAHHSLVVAPDLTGLGLTASTLVRDAHCEWLSVHVWTVRAENRFLPPALRRGADEGAHGDLPAFVRTLLDLGVDGLITDHPEIVVPARRAWLARAARAS